MISPINDVVGTKVISVTKIHDYFQIGFSNEVGLNIYNPFTIGPNSDLLQIVGLTVENTDRLPSALKIFLSGGILLMVDLRPEVYKGPEAMSLHRPGKPIVVWRADD